MKKWKIKYTVLFCALMPLIASAKITEFSTKNDVYPKPNPPSVSEVPGDVKNQILNCPSARDSLPITFHGINKGPLAYWYNAFVIVGVQKTTGYTNAVSEYVIDSGKFSLARHDGYYFDPEYNKITNPGRIGPYLNGYSPKTSLISYSKYASGTGSILVPNGSGSGSYIVYRKDLMPLFVSDTFNVGKYVDKPIYLPNKDFTVAEIFVAGTDFDLHSRGKKDEWLLKLLQDKDNHRMLSRVKLWRSGNKVNFDILLNGNKVIPKTKPSDMPDYDQYDQKVNLLKNISWRDGYGYGTYSMDVSKLKDIQVFVRMDGGGSLGGLWILANSHGQRPWKFDGTRFTPDSSVTDSMLKEANNFYENNKCFVYN
ncbi:hypothetical protein GJ26_12250 [Vibrio cholerae]|nr:hypothetical protein GJ26_12250 [Vibrio cholerae]